MRTYKNKSNNKNFNNQKKGGRNMQNPLRTQYDSNGPQGKTKGNAQQLVLKYIQSAKEAKIHGNDVLAEDLYRHAEHYQRLINDSNEIIEARQKKIAVQEEQKAKKISEEETDEVIESSEDELFDEDDEIDDDSESDEDDE